MCCVFRLCAWKLLRHLSRNVKAGPLKNALFPFTAFLTKFFLNLTDFKYTFSESFKHELSNKLEIGHVIPNGCLVSYIVKSRKLCFLEVLSKTGHGVSIDSVCRLIWCLSTKVALDFANSIYNWRYSSIVLQKRCIMITTLR